MSSFAPNDWVELSRAAVGELKGARDSMPSGKARDDIAEKIKRAEDMLARADAELAQKLGYYLCKCAFPPKPMLWIEARSSHVCAACGHFRYVAQHAARVSQSRSQRRV